MDQQENDAQKALLQEIWDRCKVSPEKMESLNKMLGELVEEANYYMNTQVKPMGAPAIMNVVYVPSMNPTQNYYYQPNQQIYQQNNLQQANQNVEEEYYYYDEEEEYCYIYTDEEYADYPYSDYYDYDPREDAIKVVDRAYQPPQAPAEEEIPKPDLPAAKPAQKEVSKPSFLGIKPQQKPEQKSVTSPIQIKAVPLPQQQKPEQKLEKPENAQNLKVSEKPQTIQQPVDNKKPGLGASTVVKSPSGLFQQKTQSTSPSKALSISNSTTTQKTPEIAQKSENVEYLKEKRTIVKKDIGQIRFVFPVDNERIKITNEMLTTQTADISSLKDFSNYCPTEITFNNIGPASKDEKAISDFKTNLNIYCRKSNVKMISYDETSRVLILRVNKIEQYPIKIPKFQN